MEPDRRLTAQGLERKQQLLDCAAELFAERGYAETRVIDIVRAAGVAKGLFYWYFENKEALFKELAASIRLNLRRRAGRRPRPRGTAAGATSTAAPRRRCTSWPSTPTSSRCSRSRAGTSPTSSARAPSSTSATWSRIIEAGQADGTIRDEDPTLLALGVVGLGRALLPLPPHRPHHRAPLDELADVRGALRRALGGRRRAGHRRRARVATAAAARLTATSCTRTAIAIGCLRPKPLTWRYAAVAQYAFLSDEWLEAAKSIREEYAGKTAPPAHAVQMNQIITEVPFGDGTIDAHMDTSSGEMEMDIGHLEDPDLTVTLDYATAKAIFVDGNPQAGMQAFMAGKIKVQGDMTKLMAMQSGTPDPAAGRDRRQDQGDHRVTDERRAGLRGQRRCWISCEGALRGALGASLARLDEERAAPGPSAADGPADEVGLAVGAPPPRRTADGRPRRSASPGCR